MDSKKQLRKREKVEENSQKKYSGGDDESPFAEQNEAFKLELPRVWEPLDCL